MGVIRPKHEDGKQAIVRNLHCVVVYISPLVVLTQLPPELYLKLEKTLSLRDCYWTLVGSKLGLLTTDDIMFYRLNPYQGGNGGVVLNRWIESPTKTYTELIAVLKDPEVGLSQTAEEVEHFLQHS